MSSFSVGLLLLCFIVANWLKQGLVVWVGGAEGDRGADQDAAAGASG